MLIPEEQPAQPALPVQPDGTRVVCGHCGNTFLVSKASHSPRRLTVLSLKQFVVSSFESVLPHSLALTEELKQLQYSLLWMYGLYLVIFVGVSRKLLTHCLYVDR